MVLVWNVVVARLPRVVYSAQLVQQLVAELGGCEIRVAARITDNVEETHFFAGVIENRVCKSSMTPFDSLGARLRLLDPLHRI
jgi:hypothetical protein